ncbi:hypothetical protein HJC23_010610 [Cyclotella cryptica]|uniref:Mannose-P-dolichol utilization defect 1 protein homolog n=1 Tax=Cyclotella cryptica TaxID=29204 RepID=A0ABD3PP33_9STRA|eukprot:CCRYP_012812-RA/>CCRYP_012812-RA protein AED:0.36 eAED:0.36 QI:145/1/1/1/1/1/2/456/265
MTMVDAITNNPFISQLAQWAWSADPSPKVSPQICVDSLPLLTMPCLSRLLAKAIGIGIICLSCINKAPVLSNMIASRSAAGLAVTAACGEVVMYSNAAFYNLLAGNPFTAYGETMVLVVQTIGIVILIFWFRRDGTDRIELHQMGMVVAGYLIYLFVVFRVLTPDTQYILMVYNPVVLLISRGSQMLANHKQKQTGAQSLATTGLNLVGTLVRIGTTIKEVGWDFHILRAYGVSVALNFILFVQLIVYKENTERFLKSLRDKKKV